MRRVGCSMCGERSRTKMATVYWAWYWPSGDRRSYKQRFDPICAMPIMHLINRGLTDSEHCVVCRERVSENPDVVVWGNAYVPGREPVAFELVYDATCFEKVADEFTTGADRLLDRPRLQAGGPPPAAAADPWADADGLLTST